MPKASTNLPIPNIWNPERLKELKAEIRGKPKTLPIAALGVGCCAYNVYSYFDAAPFSRERQREWLYWMSQWKDDGVYIINCHHPSLFPGYKKLFLQELGASILLDTPYLLSFIFRGSGKFEKQRPTTQTVVPHDISHVQEMPVSPATLSDQVLLLSDISPTVNGFYGANRGFIKLLKEERFRGRVFSAFLTGTQVERGWGELFSKTLGIEAPTFEPFKNRLEGNVIYHYLMRA